MVDILASCSTKFENTVSSRHHIYINLYYDIFKYLQYKLFKLKLIKFDIIFVQEDTIFAYKAIHLGSNESNRPLIGEYS